MKSDRPDTIAVEKRKLLRLDRKIKELTAHIEKNGFTQPEHFIYLNRCVDDLEKLVTELLPLPSYLNEATD